jgi:hypothetical protein
MSDGGVILQDGSPLPVEGVPRRAQVRSMRLSSLVLQRWEWLNHFRREPVPAGWDASPVLRDCRLAVFRDGQLEVPGLKTRLRLSPDLGLTFDAVA